MLASTPDDQAGWDSIRDGMKVIGRKVFQKLGHRVLTGPFKGMIVTDQPNWDDGNATLKLLGCYEHELWPAVELAISRQPTAVINVGCAEGYYAIGLALRLPKTEIIAFDINSWSLEQCFHMACENDVGPYVQIREGCRKPKELQLGYDHALYVLDCEGDELDLLDPARCSDLLGSDIIVECHDFTGPISYQLAIRFEPTHDVDVIEPDLPPYREYQKLLDPLPIGMKVSAITEKRPQGTIWLAMMSKQR